MSHNLPLLNHIHRCGFWGLILGKMPNKRNCNWMFLLSLSLTELSGLLGLCAIKREALALRCLTALVRQPGKPGKVITQPLQCLHTNKLNHTDQTKPHQTDRIKPNAPVRQPGKVTMQPLHTSKLTNQTTPKWQNQPISVANQTTSLMTVWMNVCTLYIVWTLCVHTLYLKNSQDLQKRLISHFWVRSSQKLFKRSSFEVQGLNNKEIFKIQLLWVNL